MKKYNDLNSYFRNIFGCRVQKITIDAGMSCPNRDGAISSRGCIYCNNRGSGTGAYAKGISITEQIICAKQALSKRYKARKFIAYFQSFSNTYAPVDRLKNLYDEALSIDDVVGLSIGTRPDCVNELILQLLQSYAKKHLIWIEYGLQSANDATLDFINRGHNFECFKKAVALTKNRGIKICAHVILGLPNESKTDMLKTAKAIATMNIDGIKLHLLYVIKGTELDKIYQSGNYKCLSQCEYAELVCDFLEILPNNVIIQRLTSDPHRDELVAPTWSVKKMETLSMIDDILDKRNSWQGKFCQ